MRQVGSIAVVVLIGLVGLVKDFSNYVSDPELTLVGFVVTTGIPMFVNLTLVATGFWLWYDDATPAVRTLLAWVLGIGLVFVSLEWVTIAHQQVRGVEIANPQQTLMNGFIRGALVGTLFSLYADRRRAAERQRRRLKRQNERLERFASILSHDLRNPLSVAKGRLELLDEGTDSEHVEPIRRAHARMGTLVDELLELARDGSNGGEPEAVALADLGEERWATVDTADATLVTDGDRVVTADRSRLGQLVENLFRNAVEHGGADVTVTVGAVEDGFYVADDGPGFADADPDKLFETGYTTNDGGTGYGLAIVRSVADAHGWTVSATESAGGGARFDVTGVDGE